MKLGSIHVHNRGYAFCAGHALKVCYMKLCVRYGGCCGVREERLLRKEGVGGRCCLRADHGMGSGKLEECRYRPPEYIKGQIGGFVLHKLYHGCRSYDFC